MRAVSPACYIAENGFARGWPTFRRCFCSTWLWLFSFLFRWFFFFDFSACGLFFFRISFRAFPYFSVLRLSATVLFSSGIQSLRRFFIYRCHAIRRRLDTGFDDVNASLFSTNTDDFRERHRRYGCRRAEAITSAAASLYVSPRSHANRNIWYVSLSLLFHMMISAYDFKVRASIISRILRSHPPRLAFSFSRLYNVALMMIASMSCSLWCRERRSGEYYMLWFLLWFRLYLFIYISQAA